MNGLGLGLVRGVNVFLFCIFFCVFSYADCKTTVEESARRTAATLDFYNREGAANYSARTENANLELQYTEFLSLLPQAKKPRILEAGCGAGRDAEYFKSLGLDIVAYDGSQSMVDFASKRLSQSVLKLDFIDVDFESEFDGIWAMSSFLHAPLEKLEEIIHRHVRALRVGGILYMSFLAPIDGAGEDFALEGPEYSRERRWLKLGKAELEPLFMRMKNISVLRLSEPLPDSVSGRHAVRWTEALVRKLR